MTKKQATACVKKSDVARLKKNLGHAHHQTSLRKDFFEECEKAMRAALCHMFNDHKHCHASWCYCKAGRKQPNECDRAVRMCNKHNLHTIKFRSLKEAMDVCLTVDMLRQTCHKFNSQKMNLSIRNLPPTRRRTHVSVEPKVQRIAFIAASSTTLLGASKPFVALSTTCAAEKSN